MMYPGLYTLLSMLLSLAEEAQIGLCMMLRQPPQCHHRAAREAQQNLTLTHLPPILSSSEAFQDFTDHSPPDFRIS